MEMRRPRQHVMEDEAEQIIRELLPSEWILRKVDKDYGIDYEIELVDEQIVSGDRIWVQSKAKERCQIRTQDFPQRDTEPLQMEYISFSLEVRELKYAVRCGFPLLLFVADLERRDVFWVPLRHEVEVNIDPARPNWKDRRNTTVRVPVRHSLQSAASEDYFGLRWFAKEPARFMAFARLNRIYRNLRYRAILSGYSIGDGWIDYGQEAMLRKSLEAAEKAILETLSIDVLFGGNAPSSFGRSRANLQAAAERARNAIALLDSGEYKSSEMQELVGFVEIMGIGQISQLSDLYWLHVEQFLVTERAALRWS